MTDYEKGMWQVLQCLAVSRYESNMHVAEDVYDFYGMSFHVYYEIGKIQPMSIEIKLK